jgi:hypothetical protein
MIRTLLVLFSLGTVFLVSAGEVQVIQSRSSVLSIYSYGGGAANNRVVPERLGDGVRNRLTAALTDVVSAPPFLGGAPLRSLKASTAAVGAQPASPSGAAGIVSGGSSSSGDFRTAAIESASDAGSKTVILRWDAPPDAAVVGYRLYVGTTSHQYTEQWRVGDQTSAEVTVNGTLYVVVTAYTDQGAESLPTEELVIGPSNVPSGSPAVSGTGSDFR